jgi:hypothetical protein
MSDFVTHVLESDCQSVDEHLGTAGLFIREITPTHERYAHRSPAIEGKLPKVVELTVAISRCRILPRLGRFP